MSLGESDTLAYRVVQILRANDQTVTCAESLTGGLIAATIIDVPGASNVIKQSYITYCDEAKAQILRISLAEIKENLAVSDYTAREMADHVRMLGCSSYGLSATGVAGPDTEDGQDVGTVFIGCASKDSVTVREYHFEGTRREIREQTVCAALNLLLECVY